MKITPPTVEVLSLPGCPHHEQTLRLVNEVAPALVPGTVVRDTRLSEEAARERGFPGSPTVLVNGRDIEGRGARAGGVS